MPVGDVTTTRTIPQQYVHTGQHISIVVLGTDGCDSAICLPRDGFHFALHPVPGSSENALNLLSYSREENVFQVSGISLVT